MPTPFIKGRFAPSPSGRMHLGNVFAALLAWLSVRSQGGRMVLRIEDLDPARTSAEKADALMRDLEWLGFTWDEGPYYQSRRNTFYEQQLQVLQDKQLVYPCFCSRSELHAASAPHASDGSYLYAGRCRVLTPQQAAQKASQRPPALRVGVPNEVVSFTDGCQGYYKENLAQQTGDFILRRSDGVFAYQLAVVADDGAMGITEVVRGRDLLASTPRQIWLQRQLGYAQPSYYHVPVLLAPDGHRLSKRERDMDLGVIRVGMPSPQPLLGKLAKLADITQTDVPISAEELIPLFCWDKVRKQDITVKSDFVTVIK